jgi:PhnB protein
MSLNVYLNFQGEAKQALDFYCEVFGVVPKRVETFGAMPANPDFPLPEGIADYIAYAEFEAFGGRVMMSDVFPGRPFNKGNNFSIMLNHKEPEILKEIFGKLAEGGAIEMELQETFWSECYGNLVDKFGIGWQVTAVK